MRKYAIGMLIAAAMLSTSACSKKDVLQHAEQKYRPVIAMQVKEESRPEVLEYYGTISSGEVRKMSFKTPGKVTSIPLDKGDPVKKGSVLARLDTKDLEYAITAARAQVDALDTQIASAESAYNYANDNYIKAQKLYKDKAASQSNLDEAKLNLDLRLSDLNKVKELKNQAAADYQQKQSMLADSVLTSDINGYVVEIPYKEGEIVPAGYPVVILRNTEQIANVGLSQNDMMKVSTGMKVEMDFNGTKALGAISNISQIPDSRTRTYNTEVSMGGSEFPLGSIIRIRIFASQLRGIWIPISSILSAEKDYVFIAEQDHAVRKEVTVNSINGSNARVEGLSSGQHLIIEGSKKLKHMDLIKLSQETR